MHHFSYESTHPLNNFILHHHHLLLLPFPPPFLISLILVYSRKMPTDLLLLLAGISSICGIALLLPLTIGFLFPHDGDGMMRDFLCGLLTHKMCDGAIRLAAVVANYAFLSGVLLSLVAGKTAASLTTTTTSGGTTSSTTPYKDATPPLVSFGRHVVGMAFDQGYRLRFSWPPAPPYADSSLRPHHSSVSDSARDGLLGCVWPKATIFLGVPLLVCLCVFCARPPLRAGIRAVHNRARLRAWLEETVAVLREKMQPTVEWMVDTIAPFFFGVTLVLTTSVGIVLYGIGHVGIATAVDSGVFGIDLASVRALLWRVWKLLFRLDWAWGWRAIFGLERRHHQHQQQRLQRQDENDILHGCGCPHRHLGDHLHDCVLHRHHCRHCCQGSDFDQPGHERHSWHHRHQPQHSLSEQELEEQEEQEQMEELEMKRELLQTRLQRRGVAFQTDGSSDLGGLGFGFAYRNSETQTGYASNSHRYPSSPSSFRHSSPIPAFLPSPELGAMPPRLTPVRWQATVEEEREAEAREAEEQEASDWENLQATTDHW